MVKTNEVRIGNLIEVNGVIRVISHIKPNLFVFEDKVNEKISCRPIHCYGVKINSERLELLGFKDVGGVDVFCYDWEEKNGVIKEYDLESILKNGQYAFCCNRTILTQLDSLHDLQNIWYSLTKNELNKTELVSIK